MVVLQHIQAAGLSADRKLYNCGFFEQDLTFDYEGNLIYLEYSGSDLEVAANKERYRLTPGAGSLPSPSFQPTFFSIEIAYVIGSRADPLAIDSSTVSQVTGCSFRYH